MSRDLGKTTAVLGPTNTGKTHLALERMMGHASGMIGFPLRLLARENYDRIRSVKGDRAVALITGEEKIIPPRPSYYVCTVEAMPIGLPVDFLAVDEIQLTSDPDRGHIFTDRLLKARGLRETMFLGSATTGPLIRRVLPDATVTDRPRFSKLTFAGHTKVTRLPRRSAVVAFSINQVYEIAERLRTQKGGTAVVLGALSPRTRNAQVDMYQAGEVDYLVATDAIGMGLNLDVHHVAFAHGWKFDGHRRRPLTVMEVAQIAGRAGRFQRDGTFGTTADCEEFEPDTIQAVEEHSFPPQTALMWRNSDLQFRSLRALLWSLDLQPPRGEFASIRRAEDHRALAALARDKEIADLCRSPADVRLLWEVCGVPDFRQTLTDSHLRLQAQLFRHLRGEMGRLPADWMAEQIDRLDDPRGDIDTLMSRIAHIRTWTYVSHRQDWVSDPAHWQARTRAIEDRLSDSLHDRLTQRFVDRRSAVLLRRDKDLSKASVTLNNFGEVQVDGHTVGRLKGYAFMADDDLTRDEAKVVQGMVRRQLNREIAAVLHDIIGSADASFTLDGGGVVLWQGHLVGRLAKGDHPLRPVVSAVDAEHLEPAEREKLTQRLSSVVQAQIDTTLEPLRKLEDPPLTGLVRGVAFQMYENFGVLPRADLEHLADLDKEQRRELYNTGMRLGALHLYIPVLTRPAAIKITGMLWCLWHDMPLPAPLPPEGRMSVEADPQVPAAFYQAIGYPVFGPMAVRVDMLDRLEKEIYAAAIEGLFLREPKFANMIGCKLDQVEGVIEALGHKRLTEDKARPVAEDFLSRKAAKDLEDAKNRRSREEAKKLARAAKAAAEMSRQPDLVDPAERAAASVADVTGDSDPALAAATVAALDAGDVPVAEPDSGAIRALPQDAQEPDPLEASPEEEDESEDGAEAADPAASMPLPEALAEAAVEAQPIMLPVLFTIRNYVQRDRARQAIKRAKAKRDPGAGPRPRKSKAPRRGPERGDRPPRPEGERPARGPRFPRGDRPERGDRPPRPDGERPARPYGDRPARPFGDRPPRPFGDRPPRPFGDRPARPVGDRPEGEGFRPRLDPTNRPFGDRPPRPDRLGGAGGGDRPPRPEGERPYLRSDDRPGFSRGDSSRPGGVGGFDRRKAADSVKVEVRKDRFTGQTRGPVLGQGRPGGAPGAPSGSGGSAPPPGERKPLGLAGGSGSGQGGGGGGQGQGPGSRPPGGGTLRPALKGPSQPLNNPFASLKDKFKG